MKCLVTGGAGFIGSNLVKTLVSENHSVTVLDNLSSGFAKNLSSFPGVELIQGDIRDDAALKRSVFGKDVVFHLAASVGNKRSIDNPIQDSEINVMGTLKLLQEMRRAGVKKIVTSSSAGIFGELKTLPISEGHPLEPNTPYGCSKLCKETQCLAFAKIYGLQAVCLRYFNVYGPNQRFDAYGNVIPIFVFQALRKETITIFGDGEQTRDFVNVQDVVQANIKSAMVEGKSGAYNIGSGERISINHLVRMICEIGNLSPKVVFGAPRPGDVRDSLADISKAKNDLCFLPRVPIEEGLREYINWAKREL